jgi:hypothetical protein
VGREGSDGLSACWIPLGMVSGARAMVRAGEIEDGWKSGGSGDDEWCRCTLSVATYDFHGPIPRARAECVLCHQVPVHGKHLAAVALPGLHGKLVQADVEELDGAVAAGYDQLVLVQLGPGEIVNGILCVEAVAQWALSRAPNAEEATRTTSLTRCPLASGPVRVACHYPRGQSLSPMRPRVASRRRGCISRHSLGSLECGTRASCSLHCALVPGACKLVRDGESAWKMVGFEAEADDQMREISRCDPCSLAR